VTPFACSLGRLDHVAGVVQPDAVATCVVTVEGYTDSRGTKAFNMQLSQERANAVKDWLVKNGNLPAPNITARGFGEQNPVAPNTNPNGSDNPAGRALNRRVSIVVEKPASAAQLVTPTATATP